jgi:hypothetical protein
MHTALTPQQSFAMAYARLCGLRNDMGDAETHALEQLCTEFDRALDDLRTSGFDLSAFQLGEEAQVEVRNGGLHARLDALLHYMDLFAGLP